MTKLDFRIVSKSILLLILFLFPLSYVHELGHAAICASEGKEFEISLGADGGKMVCFGEVDNQTLFHAAGGLTAMSVAFVPLLFLGWTRRHPYVLIAFTVLGIGHGFNAIVETLIFDHYMENQVLWASVLGMIDFVTFVGLMFKFGKQRLTQPPTYAGAPYDEKRDKEAIRKALGRHRINDMSDEEKEKSK